MSKLVSLCIPTNGVVEWIFPVLDSIYNQNVSEDLFEVVIVDNGDNKEFKKLIKEYVVKHSNIIYKESNNSGFENEIDTYRLASGEFIKFVNHRTTLNEGSLQYLIDFVNKYSKSKPFVYFSNGVLKKIRVQTFDTFDLFVRNLSYWSSWSTGMAFWKEDFLSIPENQKFNVLFPHTGILFSQRHKKEYIIDNKPLLTEILIDDTKKGKYDLFYAFCVEYPSIIKELKEDGDITNKTFKKVKKDNLSFISYLYFNFVIKGKPCSYDLSSFKTSIKSYYSERQLHNAIFSLRIKRLIQKLTGK